MFRTLRTVSGSVKGIQRSIHINAINLPLHVTISKNMSSVPWRLGQSLWKSTVAQPVPELSGPNENDTFGDAVTLSGGAVSRAGTEVGDDGDLATGRHDDDGDDSAMSTEMFRKTHHIKIQNEGEENHYIPFDSFDSTPFPEKLKRLLLKQGYTAPTPTQAQSWPIALAGRDIISIARTGSGKVQSLDIVITIMITYNLAIDLFSQLVFNLYHLIPYINICNCFILSSFYLFW